MNIFSTSRTARVLLGAALLTVLAGCAVDSPPRHTERLQKASGLRIFSIDTTKELWDKTSHQDPYEDNERPIKARITNLPNGLERVQLTGVSLANYLRALDSTAHGGSDGESLSRHDPESIRMYNEVSAELDSITKRPGPDDPPPHITVDTAFFDTKNPHGN